MIKAQVLISVMRTESGSNSVPALDTNTAIILLLKSLCGTTGENRWQNAVTAHLRSRDNGIRLPAWFLPPSHWECAQKWSDGGTPDSWVCQPSVIWAHTGDCRSTLGSLGLNLTGSCMCITSKIAFCHKFHWSLSKTSPWSQLQPGRGRGQKP